MFRRSGVEAKVLLKIIIFLEVFLGKRGVRGRADLGMGEYDLKEANRIFLEFAGRGGFFKKDELIEI